ncbi:MAG: UPF0182 family protein [Acidimicrobiia bacterium]
MSSRPVAPPFPVVAWLDRRTRFQRRLGLLAVALVALFGLARIVADMVLDKWWFDTVTNSDVWSTKVGAQILLASAAGLISGVALIGSAIVALRTRPAPDNAPNRVVVRYRERMGPAHGWALVGIAVYLTLRIAVAAMGRWKPWLLFLEGPHLGVTAPDVGWDLGYHLFRLPFLTVLSSWLRQMVVVAFGLAVVGQVANGALKLPRQGRQSSRRALRHLGLLAAVFAILQALDYLLVRWPATGTNQYGAFDGPGYTEVKLLIPGYWALAVVAVVTAILLVRGLLGGRWRAPLIAIGTWGVVQVVLLGVVPGLVNRLVVAPAEAERQLPYIAHNLEATKTAYSLNSVTQVTETFADGLSSPPDLTRNEEINQLPLFGESMLVAPLQVLQGTTGTRITDVDLDRYRVDGDLQPVLIAARNAYRADLPERGWVQLHLVYTHGDGVVAVPADSTSSDGRPDVDALANELAPTRSELYFGENLAGWYAIVGTKRTELGDSTFAGETGIPLSNFWRRLVLALRVGEIEPLVSAELGPGSQLLFRRDVKERLGTVAPFLSFDANPYPVVADGRITWVVDGYTTASTYPHSQFARDVGLSAESGLAGHAFNYVHASVKATVDAYDGSVHLYRTEVGGSDDPVLDAWSTIFPGLIEPISNMPDTLRQHLLYPQDMLTVQTAMLGRYHVSDAETLFNGSDSWAISASAGEGVARLPSTATTDAKTIPAAPVSLFMPGSEPLGGHWVAIRPYGPGSALNPTSTRDELAALAIADHDNPENLVLVRIDVESGRLISSPKVAQAAIDTDRDLAALFTLLNANGSAVQFGPMTPIPLEGALVWARSVIVTGTADTTAPRLYGVTAVSNGLVGQADSVADALNEAVRALSGS